MRFAVMVYPGDSINFEAGEMPSQEMMQAMDAFNEKLADAGMMLFGEGFRPSAQGLRVRFGADGKPAVTPGPFAEPGGIAGFWVWRASSQDEALAWAKRAPMGPGDTLEIRQLYEASDFGPEAERQEAALQEKIRRHMG